MRDNKVKIPPNGLMVLLQLILNISKLTVFLAAIAALAVMTVLSALLGFVVTTFIPREYTYYACTAIMFLFGQFGFYHVNIKKCF